MVKEIPTKVAAEITHTSDHKIRTWCCLDQGVSTIECQFEKNTFEPHE